MSAPKKTRACMPCHKRKVRCDASLVGTPCSRCSRNACEDACVPSPRFPRRHGDGPDHGAGLQRNRFMTQFEAFRRREPGSSETEEAPAPSPLSTSSYEDRTSLQQDSEQRASADPSTQNISEDNSRRFVVEYYKEFNPVTILADSLDQPRREGLLHIEDAHALSQSAKERELATLDSVDQYYLSERRVHCLPPDKVCTSLIRLFFRYASVHVPIIEHDRFLREYQHGICSTMLLYAVLMNALPSISAEDLRAMGETSVLSAQAEFFTRAKILYDFGCERNELSLLQSFVLLGSFQHTLDAKQDSRFWFGNAVRLALQMGLHKRCIEREVDSGTYKVCRRIWWFLMHRDVFSVIVGLESTQKIMFEDTDTSAVTLQNFCEDVNGNEADTSLYLPDRFGKLYFIEFCKLSQLGSTFLHLFRSTRTHATATEWTQFERGMEGWRSHLPTKFNSNLASDLNSLSKSCVVTLHMFAFQMEVLFYRTIRARKLVSSADIDRKLQTAIVEATTLFRKAVSLDVVRFTPPFLNEFIAQLVAVQISTTDVRGAVSGGSARAFSLQADFLVFVAYFEEFEKTWPAATKYSRLFKQYLNI